MNKVLLNTIAAIGSSLAVLLANAGEPVRVLASLPVTYGLGAALLHGTQAQISRAAPANLPASRQIAYFTGRGAGALQKAASDADAVIALRSLWPEDPLYPMARRSNIRIVEVDAARPVDGALPGIALSGDEASALADQPWLSINNLGRMADVIAADLARLSPDDAAQIARNLGEIKQRLLTLNATSEGRLAELDNLGVASLSPGFAYLITSLNLDEVALPAAAPGVKPEPAWIEQLKTTLEENDVRLVLSDRQSDKALASAIEAAGARLLIVDGEAEDPVAALASTIDQVISALSQQ
jgi:ABC-type Zn uptake system ZnuABC Zn-binding protein ZnuA